MNQRRDATTRSVLHVLARIAGSVVGLLIGSFLALLVFLFIVAAVAGPISSGDMSTGGMLVVLFGPLAALVGAIIGAAGETTMTQEFLKQRSSFWRALLGAVVGAFALPVIGAVPGAVLGSGWGAKPADALVVIPQQGGIPLGDTPKPQLGQAKCPFCRSIAFRVVQEAGCRRCSDFYSVLPKYIQGNRCLAERI